jgi:hypothetical protein
VEDEFISSPTLFCSPRKRSLFSFPSGGDQTGRMEDGEELDPHHSQQRYWCKEKPLLVALSLIASGCPLSYEIARSSPLFDDVFKSIILHSSDSSLLIGARAVRAVSSICMEEASFTVLETIVPSFPKASVPSLDSGMVEDKDEVIHVDMEVDTDTDTGMGMHGGGSTSPCSMERVPRAFHSRSEWKRLHIARDLIQCHGGNVLFWGEEPKRMALRVFVWCTETLVAQKSRPEHWRLANEILNLIENQFEQMDEVTKPYIYGCTIESMQWIGNTVDNLRILMGRLDGHPLKRKIKRLLAWKILHVLGNTDRNLPLGIVAIDDDSDRGGKKKAHQLQVDLMSLLDVVALNDALSVTVFADSILCLTEMIIDSPHFESNEVERFRDLMMRRIKRFAPKKKTFAHCRIESAIRRIGVHVRNAGISVPVNVSLSSSKDGEFFQIIE